MSLPPNTAPAMRSNGRAPSGNNLRLKTVALRIGFFGVLILIWQLIATMKLVPEFVFPAPKAVLLKFVEIWNDGTLFKSVTESLRRMLVGYSISIVGGLTIGILAARSWLFKETLGTAIMSLQSLPSVCWLPFALVWIGLSESAILAVLILGALFSIAVATEGAIRNISPIYLKVGRVMGARGFRFAFDILFFAALPELIGGLKLGWTFAWRSLMAAELIRNDVAGVGHLLEIGRNFNDIALMIAAMLVILAIGMVVDQLIFGSLERIIRRRYGLEKNI